MPMLCMKEINLNLNLDFEQVRVLDHHSLLNILNVIVYELMVLQERVPGRDELQVVLDEVHETANALALGKLSSDAIIGIGGLKSKVLQAVDAKRSHLNDIDERYWQETVTNLHSIFEILELRIGELKRRGGDLWHWEWVACTRIEENLRSVFSALSRNSRGRYGFTEDANGQRTNDYLIQLDIRGTRNATIFMPPVIQDVVRDLAANSRKYTEPGGTLAIRMTQTARELEFEVRDTGIGIPADEIPGIFGFGHRGSNVQNRRTMGGGFGLTKAYYVVQMFGGRMWMESQTGEDSGTSILCRLPLPEEGVGEQ